MTTDTNAELALRRSTEADRDAIIDLCRASLGWRSDDPNEAFFAWKHRDNAFGESPSWVAVAEDGAIVGLRVFMRWGFRDPSGATLRAVRAVDTATHPDWQGRGIFTKLTLGAIPDLRDDGVDLVFNTPNDKSRPGYLKMGWSQVGRVPVGIRPTSAAAVSTIAKARTAAELWSEASDLGVDAAVAFADDDAVERLLARCIGRPRIATDRSAAYLRWRYGFAPLAYRVVPVGDRLEDGVLVVRLRRRGPALECAVCDVLLPPGAGSRALMAHVAAASGAHYLLRCVGLEGLRDGFLPAPQLGPILTWRPVCRTGVPTMRDLSLALGDVELF
jgi:GNAT superfamily N-acetyltransferase